MQAILRTLNTNASEMTSLYKVGTRK